MANELPYMPFFGLDFYTSERVMLMSATAEVVYMRMLWAQWRSGALPDNPKLVARLIARDSSEVMEVWNEVRPCFEVDDDGKIRNPRLEQERDAVVKKSTARKRAAQARWGSEHAGEDAHEHAGPNAEVDANDHANENADTDAETDAQDDASNPCKTDALSEVQITDKKRERIQSKSSQSSDFHGGEPPSRGSRAKKSNPVHPAAAIIGYLNEKAGKHYQGDGAQAKFVKARLRDGATEDQMRLVIDHRVALWLGDSKFRQYLRPETLFSAKHWEDYYPAAKEWDDAGRPEPRLIGKGEDDRDFYRKLAGGGDEEWAA